MRRSVWRKGLVQLTLTLAIACVIGLESGQMGYSLAAALGCYCIWLLSQLRRLQLWLQTPEINQPPSSYGIWGEVFDEIHRLQRRNNQTRHRLQSVINRFQDSTAALRDGVLIVDHEGNLEWWNNAAGRYLGLKAPTDTGHLLTNLIRAPEFHEYFAQEEPHTPLVLKSPARPELTLEFSITLFGRQDRLLVVRDITRIAQLEQMRKDFVGNVSHELRTPLTVLVGYLETMDMAKDMLPERWQRMISQMGQQSGRMENIIKELLMLSKLETGRSDTNEKVDVEGLLTAIKKDAIALSGDKGHDICLCIQADCRILGDTNELRSAFSNLIFNAVKYTPAGTRIEIIWQQGRESQLIVRDFGPGIDAVHLPRLTERFYRVDPSRDNSTGGTGLGLAIVKHILLRHDGELTLSSEVGHGSEFICHFPLSRCVAAPTDISAALA